MSDFQSSTTIKRTRKPHACEHFEQTIEAGSPAHKISGRYEDFYCIYTHVECEAAGIEWAQNTGCWGEEFMWLNQIDEREDFLWLLEDHPIVAERLNAKSRIET